MKLRCRDVAAAGGGKRGGGGGEASSSGGGPPVGRRTQAPRPCALGGKVELWALGSGMRTRSAVKTLKHPTDGLPEVRGAHGFTLDSSWLDGGTTLPAFCKQVFRALAVHVPDYAVPAGLAPRQRHDIFLHHVERPPPAGREGGGSALVCLPLRGAAVAAPPRGKWWPTACVSQQPRPRGYWRVRLGEVRRTEGGAWTWLYVGVHRLMCWLRHGPPPPRPDAGGAWCDACHLRSCQGLTTRGCAHPAHVEWQTPSQNLHNRWDWQRRRRGVAMPHVVGNAAARPSAGRRVVQVVVPSSS